MAIELTTPRLLLRRWRIDDFEVLARFLMDPQLARYRLGAIDRHQAWDFMCAQLGQWELRGYGIFAITRKGESTPIGYTGLWHPVVFDEPEVAYSLFAGHHGHGYATEAAGRVLAWATGELGLKPPMSLIHPDNAASIKVAERLGARLEGEKELRSTRRLVYRHRQPAEAVR